MPTYPFWYKMLYNRLYHKQSTGLPLPYLIGALAIENKTRAGIKDIDALIDEMLTIALPHIIILGYDTETGQHLFTLFERGRVPMYHYPVSGNFYVAYSMEDNFTDAHAIKAYCKSCYKKQIIEKKFSFHNGGWHHFYEDDHQFIKNSSTVIIRSGKALY